jgi:hypothetical protein
MPSSSSSSSSEQIKHIPKRSNILVNHLCPRGNRKNLSLRRSPTGCREIADAKGQFTRPTPCYLYDVVTYSEHMQHINNMLQLSVHNSVRCTYSTPTNSQQFFYMQETSILSSLFIHFLYSLMMDQQDPKHVWDNFSIHGSVHRSNDSVDITNKMQPCIRIQWTVE